MQDPDTSHLTGAAPAKQEPMAAKKKPRRIFPPAFKRQTVARIRAGKESGKETITAIAKDIKVSPNVLYTWAAAASKKGAKAPKNGKAVARATEPELAPAPPPVQASLEGCLAAIEQASATIRALRRQLFGG
jgi:transposase-like protein